MQVSQNCGVMPSTDIMRGSNADSWLNLLYVNPLPLLFRYEAKIARAGRCHSIMCSAGQRP